MLSIKVFNSVCCVWLHTSCHLFFSVFFCRQGRRSIKGRRAMWKIMVTICVEKHDLDAWAVFFVLIYVCNTVKLKINDSLVYLKQKCTHWDSGLLRNLPKQRATLGSYFNIYRSVAFTSMILHYSENLKLWNVFHKRLSESGQYILLYIFNNILLIINIWFVALQQHDTCIYLSASHSSRRNEGHLFRCYVGANYWLVNKYIITVLIQIDAKINNLI